MICAYCRASYSVPGFEVYERVLGTEEIFAKEIFDTPGCLARRFTARAAATVYEGRLGDGRRPAHPGEGPGEQPPRADRLEAASVDASGDRGGAGGPGGDGPGGVSEGAPGGAHLG